MPSQLPLACPRTMYSLCCWEAVVDLSLRPFPFVYQLTDNMYLFHLV
jgi:hypothetical protein